MTTILIVEDELLIANYLKDVVEKEGYSVVGIAKDSQEAIRLFREHSPRVVCMDIKLKGNTDGVQTARALREIGSFLLVYLTAHGDRDIIAEAQDTRPVGFLVKPVTDQTILATITTAIANDPFFSIETPLGIYKITTNEHVTITVDLANAAISSEKKPVSLTPNEVAFLELLLKRHERVCSKEDLKQYIWPHCHVEDASLKTLVWRLRRKIPAANIIRTMAGFGYQINGSVRPGSE